uniref:lipopolysaccharide assembly protein LapA domain-containing protein n=1 Tax=Thaumasiovibrio occultus TaxID=1891184 RepID=UPI000B35BECC|nr:LapA family protein [Thaumasiovibrio occultus]
MSVARVKLAIFILLLILLAVFALAFASQNEAEVTFSYLVGSGTFALSQVLSIAFLTGFVVSFLVFGLSSWRANLAKKRLTKKLAARQSELDKVRAELKQLQEAKLAEPAMAIESAKE